MSTDAAIDPPAALASNVHAALGILSDDTRGQSTLPRAHCRRVAKPMPKAARPRAGPCWDMPLFRNWL